MPLLTAALIVKNEEQLLPGLISTLRRVADEVVITDTGSTDRTVEIIKKSTARLYRYAWDGNEAAARNFTLAQCRTDWILCIDADELISPADGTRIRQYISRPRNPYLALRVLIRHYLEPRVIIKTLFTQSPPPPYMLLSAIRIFRNHKAIAYQGLVYPTVNESLRDRQEKVCNSEAVFHHVDTVRARGKQAEKKAHYQRTVADNVRAFPQEPQAQQAMAHYQMLQGNYRTAIRYYTRALLASPGDARLRLGLGLGYVLAGQEQKGMRLIQTEPDKRFAWEQAAYVTTAYSIIARRMRVGTKRSSCRCP